VCGIKEQSLGDIVSEVAEHLASGSRSEDPHEAEHYLAFA